MVYQRYKIYVQENLWYIITQKLSITESCIYAMTSLVTSILYVETNLFYQDPIFHDNYGKLAQTLFT